jgi:hypothetical protein
VMKKAGSSAVKMVLLRLVMGLAAGWFLNLLLPGAPTSPSSAPPPVQVAVLSALFPALSVWGLSTLKLMIKIIIIVIVLMIIQRLLEEFKVANLLARTFAPIMRIFGLPESASILWLVINIVGYSYGAAVIMEQIRGGKMKKQEADLLNHHAAMCHSLLEDTVLYSAIGVSLFWLTVPRLIMALVIVWLERLRRTAFRRSFRVGTV